MIDRRSGPDWFAHAVLWTGILVMAFPVYLTFIASTHEPSTIANGQMPLVPGDKLLETYWQTIFVGPTRTSRMPVGAMMVNTLVMALVIAIGKICISIVSAYAVVYFRFPFRRTAFWMIFMTLMLPVEVRIYPTYNVVASLGLLDTFAGLTVPLIASATGTLLFRQFFMTIPDELLEAARMDHASEWRIYWRIILPLSAPALAVLAIFSVMWRWNDFLLPLIVLSKNEFFTLQLALNSFQGELNTQWHYLLAMTVITLLPVTLVFAFLQRHVTTGIASAGVK